MKDNTLHLFFGRQPDENFSEDLEALKKLPEAEVLELIDKIIHWHTEEEVFEKEWSKLTENLNQEQKEEKLKPIRALLFVLKEFISENISKDELTEDLEILELPKKYADKFTELEKSVEKEFHKKILKSEKPYENALIDIDWRIDTKHYRDGAEKKVAFIEFIYSDQGDKKVAQFDLSSKALKHLVHRLKKIEEEL